MTDGLTGAFQRKIGAYADLKELLYVSTLHQSHSNLRFNATVSATDIRLYLTSKYGIIMSDNDANDIVYGLSGTSGRDVIKINTSESEANVKNGSDEEKNLPSDPTDENMSSFESSLPNIEEEIKYTNPVTYLGSSLPNIHEDIKTTRPIKYKGSSLPITDEDKVDLEIIELEQKKLKCFEEVKKDLGECKFDAATSDPIENVTSKNDGANKTHKEKISQVKDGIHARVNVAACNIIENVTTKNKMVYKTYKETMGHVKKKIRTITTKVKKSEGFLDIIDLTSIIIIPTLLSLAKELTQNDQQDQAIVMRQTPARKKTGNIVESQTNVFSDVLNILMTHHTSLAIHDKKQTEDLNDHSTNNNIILTETLLKDIFQSFSCNSVAKDESLLEEMINAAGGPGTVFDERALARALTSDVTAWNVGTEDDWTTSFYDVFGVNRTDTLEDFLLRDNEFRNGGENSDDNDCHSGSYKVDDTTTRWASTTVEPSSSVRRVASDGMPLDCNNEVDNNISIKIQDEFTITTNNNSSKDVSGLKNDMPSDDNSGQQPSSASVVVNNNDYDDDDDSLKNEFDDNAKQQRWNKNKFLAILPQKNRTISSSSPRIIGRSSYIDFCVDIYYSRVYQVVLWLFYMFTIGGYVIWAKAEYPVNVCKDIDDFDFGCVVFRTYISWFAISSFLCLGGILIIVPISMGNNANFICWKRLVFSFIAVIVHWLNSSRILMLSRNLSSEDSIQRMALNIMLWLDLIFMCILVVILIGHLMLVVTPKERMKQYPDWLQKILISANTLATAKTKHAATYKVNTLLKNASMIHHHVSPHHNNTNVSQNDRDRDALINFILHGSENVDCGGIMWTWKQIWNDDLFRREGVWIPTRIIIAQVAQVFLLVLLIVYGCHATYLIALSAENARAEIQAEKSSQMHKDWLLQYAPEKWMIYNSFYPAIVVSSFVGVLLILIYIPSMVSTTLKFRCGAIPSFDDQNYFLQYRTNANYTYVNLGNMCYALFGSMLLYFLIVVMLLFLSYWPITQHVMAFLVAWGLGLGLTMGVTYFGMQYCRVRYHAAFFRKHPRSGNFASLMLECLNIALGGSVLLSRLSQFLFAAAFWIGRTDDMFLHENVNIYGYSFDYFPINFRKEILVHEAHRHPFMERLGAMYMMRLRHGKQFSSKAGACWRNIFVMALMPWMIEYMSSGDEEKDESDETTPLVTDIVPCNNAQYKVMKVNAP